MHQVPARRPSFQLKPIVDISRIFTVFYYEFSGDYQFEGESHNFWEFVYVDKGECKLFNSGRTFHMKTGNIYFHKPNTFHALYGMPEQNFNVLIISFSCKSETMNAIPDEMIQVSGELRSVLSKITRECRNAFYLPIIDKDIPAIQAKRSTLLGARQLIKLYMEEFLILLMRKEHLRNAKNPTLSLLSGQEVGQENLVASIKAYLLANLREKITIDDLCREFHYSKTYICTNIKKATGYSVIEFINQAKTERAKDLIRENKMSLTQISEALGFSGLEYFSKVFKQYAGLSPSGYKKKLKTLLGYTFEQ
ncbi:MAG: helix-turn-helix transcriptional regulator [Clostridia bacterium]|nr:helix-turn-helix transcriptional regulator [Clostridia bacterium]